jgi:hypothetical protein
MSKVAVFFIVERLSEWQNNDYTVSHARCLPAAYAHSRAWRDRNVVSFQGLISAAGLHMLALRPENDESMLRVGMNSIPKTTWLNNNSGAYP